MSVWLRRVNGWLTVLCAVLLRGSRHRQPWMDSIIEFRTRSSVTSRNPA
jgi:hypothetical protein